jgi:methionyl-tRNA formyltransferase
MSAPRSVIFMGTPAFAAECLHALAADKRFSVTLVVSQPDKPAGREKKIESTPVKSAAIEHGIPVFQPESVNKELAAYLQERGIERPDFAVVVAYGKILSQEVLDLPRIAPINVHASLLPRWRGASPIEHAILAGDTVTGISIQRMVKELDAGPILSEESLEIHPEETTVELKIRLMKLAARMLPGTLAKPLQEKPQDDTKATFCGKLSREDGIADASTMTAEEIHRKVRALVPWPGVTCAIEGQTVKLLQTSLAPSATGLPIPCKDGTILYALSVQPAGKRPMQGKDFGNGLRNMQKSK